MYVNQLPSSKPRIFYGYVIVCVVFVILAVMWGTLYAFGVYFNALLADFGWTKAMTSGAFSLSVVFLALFAVIAGRLSDRFGPRVVLTVGGLLLGTGCLLMSRIETAWQLYLYYGVIIGVGMSTSFVPPASTVARWFVKRRGMMTGIAVSGLSVGTLVMPPFANWLISVYGWRTAYIVTGVTVLIAVVSAAQFLRRDPDEIGQLPYGVNELEDRKTSPTDFSLSEVVHTRQFWMLDVAVLFFGVSLGAVLVHIVPHSIGLGVSPANAALVLALVGGGGIIGRVVMGAVCDRIGNKPALVICFCALSTSLFSLLVAEELWGLFLFAIIFGFGYGGISALVSPMLAELFGLRSLGAILGLTASIGGDGGSAIGSVVAGYIFDVTGSYYRAYLICAVISAIGLVLILLLKPTSWSKA